MSTAPRLDFEIVLRGTLDNVANFRSRLGIHDSRWSVWVLAIVRLDICSQEILLGRELGSRGISTDRFSKASLQSSATVILRKRRRYRNAAREQTPECQRLSKQ